MKEIMKITSNFSIGVTKEIESLDKLKEFQYKLLEESKNAQDYFSNKTTSSTATTEYSSLIKYLPSGKLKILDIGVGLGQSSIYLASLGHNVYSLEPNATYCDIIFRASEKFILNITVIEGIAEDILNINEFNFDAIFFNASLHHCDDPNKALKSANLILKEKGIIILASENFLRPWMTKSKWYFLLNNFPEKMGHYGGNEHIYYNWEYIDFLKESKFRNVQLSPSAYETSPIERLEHILSKRINGIRVYNEKRLLIRFIFYILSAKLLKNTFIFLFLSKKSIVQAHFIGYK